MEKIKRCDWILVELASMHEHASVDILNQQFVDDYLTATGAVHSVMMYGAHKCPSLARDLSAMALKGFLNRSRVGLPGMSGEGFPKWVYSYRLTVQGRREAELAAFRLEESS
jgi:hypothetical protein